ncbi:hypothetical protein LQU94_03915 [Peptoniphilus sp. KCTC 25270]|uniref:hypothetical protein n=1 Tax=Peptoniphilus sp. KCTC 25270 TaxID=2897414 RepID=UPI001E4BCD46|nr:hypothetical protein [Peptoniphilus sp. KCTC 25270]MCD1147251.1 hypothetical protein [Peptoniphilus sp. KCTC 25270]
MSLESNMWKRFMESVGDFVYSALDAIDWEESFPDEDMNRTLSFGIDRLGMGSWLTLDVVENQESTRTVLHQIWSLMSQEQFKEEKYLDAVFRSYFGIYQVNEVREDSMMVQDLVIKGHGILVEKRQDLLFHEGDIFLGRILFTEEGNFLFQTGYRVDHQEQEDFKEQFRRLTLESDKSYGATKDLPMYLSKGSPDIILLYSLTREKLEEEKRKDIETIDGEGEKGVMGFYSSYIREEKDDFANFNRGFQQLNFIQEKCLDPKGESFHDHDLEIDLYEVMERACKEGWILSDEDLMEIHWAMYHFLLAKGKGEEAKKFQEGIVLFKKYLSESTRGIYCDEFLRQGILEADEPIVLPFFMGFESMMDVIYENDIPATKTGKLPKALVEALATRNRLTKYRQVQAPDERHFPILELWKRFAVAKGFLEIENQQWEVGNLYQVYKILDWKEKLSLWLTSLGNREFTEVLYEDDETFLFKKENSFHEEFTKRLEKVLEEGENLKLGQTKTEKDLFFLELFYLLWICEPNFERILEADSHITDIGYLIADFMGLGQEDTQGNLLTFPNTSVED